MVPLTRRSIRQRVRHSAVSAGVRPSLATIWLYSIRLLYWQHALATGWTKLDAAKRLYGNGHIPRRVTRSIVARYARPVPELLHI
jgi:hypothetical protein